MLDPPSEVAEVASSDSYAAATPQLSVLISTFRRPHYLDGLFDTLEAQDLDPTSFEVVIADNASGDTTWEVLCGRIARTHLAARAVRVERNGGPATGRNAAVSHARAALVAFTDDDCLAEPQWARAMLHALRGGAVIVQGRTEPESGVPRGTWDHTIAIRQPTTLFETCNLGYRRDDVIDAGGFRPLKGHIAGRGGQPFGGEDTVLGWDIARAKGTTVVFATDAVVHHRIEPRDVRGWINLRKGMGIFPALVANVPEMRDQFFLRYFFSARSAAFDLSTVSLATAALLRSPLPLAGVVPYIAMNTPRGKNLRSWARRLGPYVVADATSAWALLRGSIRQRRAVL